MFWQRFKCNGVPEYLARHYWWAYLWRIGVVFFDHQTIVNIILFGQYEKLANHTLERFDAKSDGNTLQLTCVYGNLSTKLAKRLPIEAFHLADVATIQLNTTRKKLHKVWGDNHAPLNLVRLNAESLAYQKNCFSCIVIFFLFHELPTEARQHAIEEIVRVLKPGGKLIITEYSNTNPMHILHRFPPFRFVLSSLEPYLPGFLEENLLEKISAEATRQNKSIKQTNQTNIFNGFYRVVEINIAEGV